MLILVGKSIRDKNRYSIKVIPHRTHTAFINLKSKSNSFIEEKAGKPHIKQVIKVNFTKIRAYAYFVPPGMIYKEGH